MWSWDVAIQDELNAEIWAKSPKVQGDIQTPLELGHEGAVGAQQAMIEDGLLPGVTSAKILPWVPDLVGAGWAQPDALLVVGSAYAGFIKELSRRPHSLPLAKYVPGHANVYTGGRMKVSGGGRRV
jgi:hypothetical protein